LNPSPFTSNTYIPNPKSLR